MLYTEGEHSYLSKRRSYLSVDSKIKVLRSLETSMIIILRGVRSQ